MNSATRVQFLNEAVCVSHNASILDEDMNPTIFPQAMCKY